MTYFVHNDYVGDGQFLVIADSEGIKAMHAQAVSEGEITDTCSEEEILNEYEAVHWATRCESKQALLRAVNEMVK